MKLLVFAVFLFVVSSFAQQQCGDTQCAEGECCVVYMFFTRRCQKLATERQLCWRRNENVSTYLWICPCETGLLCHMNRCRSDRNRSTTTLTPTPTSGRTVTTPTTETTTEGTTTTP
uniref:U29-Hexatoxin-Hf1b_1 n=1 Tax=Hadronyche formidabilis TaxID=426499 RepID=A0A4Q8K0Y1_HADFO